MIAIESKGPELHLIKNSYPEFSTDGGEEGRVRNQIIYLFVIIMNVI